MDNLNENTRKQFLINEPGKEQREAFKQMETSSSLLLSRLSSFLPQMAKENDMLFSDLESGKIKAADVDIEVLGNEADEEAGDEADEETEEPQHIAMVFLFSNCIKNLGIIGGKEEDSDQDEAELLVNTEPKEPPAKKLVQEL
jgi:hypothetical protein